MGSLGSQLVIISWRTQTTSRSEASYLRHCLAEDDCARLKLSLLVIGGLSVGKEVLAEGVMVGGGGDQKWN